jgi:hypothetical protein
MSTGILTGKHIERRTFLKGAGASVALPFLDAMVPAGRSWSLFAPAIDNTRLVCIEECHGLPGCNAWGAARYLYAPEIVGKDFKMVADSALKPLEPYQEYLTVVSNTDVRMAEAAQSQEIGGDHFRSTSVYLTQSHPRQTQGSDLFVGISLDQMHAARFGQDTTLPSLQLCIESVDQAGNCSYNYSCAYTDSLSWAKPDEPLPMIRDPRQAFDLIFGAGGTNPERAIRRATQGSILDWVTGQIAAMRSSLSAQDRQRLERYTENIREVERRIQKVEAYNNSGQGRELPEAPPGVPDSFTEHMEQLFDIQVLAFETDMTRVVTFKTGRDNTGRRFPESGSDQSFHGASHHGNQPDRIMEWNVIQRFRIGQLPYFLDKLKATMEGDTHLLDKTAIMWGSPMSDGNVHAHRRCPLMFLGKGNGILEGNIHIKAPDGTPMANAQLALMQGLGHDMESFGDSNGTLALKYGARSAQSSTQGL